MTIKLNKAQLHQALALFDEGTITIKELQDGVFAWPTGAPSLSMQLFEELPTDIKYALSKNNRDVIFDEAPFFELDLADQEPIILSIDETIVLLSEDLQLKVDFTDDPSLVG